MQAAIEMGFSLITTSRSRTGPWQFSQLSFAF
jgi:hypothetical protein